MRRWIIIGLLTAIMEIPALGALRFGLGDAVAKRSADLINKAGNYNLVGSAAAAALPACGASALYTVDPLGVSNLTAMVPIGNLSPTGHVFPSDHGYIYMVPGNYPLLAPGNVTITDIKTTTYLNASPVYSDYTITFYACRDVQTYFAHVKGLSTLVTSQMGQFSNESCSSYTTGGTSVQSCDLFTNIPVSAGTPIGTVNNGADYGTYDDRVAPLAFANPNRHFGNTFYTACPLSYFIPSIQNSYKAKLGTFNETVLYDGSSPCGMIMYDVAGTASGDWFNPSQPNNPEDPHMALVHDNVRTTWEAISIGTSGPGSSGVQEFIPNSSGFVDRDFAQVTSDGHLYCYDTFRDVFSGNPTGNSIIYLIQLTSPTTIEIDRQSAAGCGAGPWAFSGSAVTYQR
jgi:hypothetical protein